MRYFPCLYFMRWRSSIVVNTYNVDTMRVHALPWVLNAKLGPAVVVDPQFLHSQFFAGLLLSDGHLYKTYKVTHNSAFSLEMKWGDPGLSMVVSTFTLLKSAGLATGNFVERKRTAEVKPNVEQSYGVAYGYSLRHALFTDLRHIWYPNGYKIVPGCVKDYLSPVCLYTWFAGDGNARGAGVEFNTQSFQHDDVLFLADILLTKYQLQSEIQTEGKGYVIVLKQKAARQFAGLIHTLVPTCYSYKLKHLRN
uniref:LAGLIDADG DNA endonuclease n=1 Tax=Chlamydomonas reinhardtii TaxID=3055 RepID=B2XYE2_CHLRE|nr:LAGLIDADG DNA endonuclease [Chlamydomonas reinhardtii]